MPVDAFAETLTVNLGDRSYPIQIGENLLQNLLPIIGAQGNFSRLFVITDSNVVPLLPTFLRSPCSDNNMSLWSHVIPAGEASKCSEQVQRGWDFLAEHQAGRDSAVVAIGGGVVGDLAGFVAATYSRGIALIQVPTTLLAQVDSSVGGKVGINLRQGKNLVGAFWQPRLVVADLKMVQSLPDREIAAGLAEVVKYGLIADADFFSFLEMNIASIRSLQSQALGHVVQRSCQIKADVVGDDERELTGRRAILNYGHTFAHALEATLGYGKILHGEAVAIGMDCAARLARRRGLIDSTLVERQRQLLQSFGLPTQIPMPAPSAERMLKAMQHDKKVSAGQLRFVLPVELGLVKLVSDIPQDDILAILEERG